MFNIEKRKEKAKKEYTKTLDVLKECEGFEEYVVHINNEYIFFKTMTYNKCIELLHKFAKGRKYKLSHYYYNESHQLAITYGFVNFCIVLLCNEPEKAIEILGGGKCRTVIKTIEEKKVVCSR